MTGMLAVAGVIVVLLASVYVGLTADASPSPAPVIQSTPIAESTVPITEEAPAPTAQPEATATAVDPTNRQNCDAIRGTAYLSDGERTWFLANCTNS